MKMDDFDLDDPTLYLYKRSKKVYLPYISLLLGIAIPFFCFLVFQEHLWQLHHPYKSAIIRSGSPWSVVIPVFGTLFAFYISKILAETLYVNANGLGRRNSPIIPWAEIHKIVHIKPLLLEYILVFGKNGQSIQIPWPLEQPEAFEQCCTKYAALDNPIRQFLEDCSMTHKRQGGVPKQYEPQVPEV